MSARREFSALVKREAWKRCNGMCEADRLPEGVADFPKLCINVPKELDHIEPDCLGGEPTLENSAWLCRQCHAEKTKADASARKTRNAHRVRKDRPKTGWFQPGRKLQSRPFRKAEPQRSASRPLSKGVGV